MTWQYKEKLLQGLLAPKLKQECPNSNSELAPMVDNQLLNGQFAKNAV
jgi:hypothetical protein